MEDYDPFKDGFGLWTIMTLLRVSLSLRSGPGMGAAPASRDSGPGTRSRATPKTRQASIVDPPESTRVRRMSVSMSWGFRFLRRSLGLI